MKCPFLRESWVKFCQAAPYKKVIERTAGAADLCTSPAFHGCVAFREHEHVPAAPPCPFLHESRAQVCSQDPAVRLVPCSDQSPSRCVTANHRYCEIFIASTPHGSAVRDTAGDILATMPSTLFYTRNHMWIDISEERNCHVGLDALLTRMLGRVDKLSFVTSQGQQCPSVLLTAYGASLHLIFPNPMQITSLNGQVRVEPDRLLHDPYGAGWLFEGVEAGGTDVRTGLLSGEKARRWMENEVKRMANNLQGHARGENKRSGTLAADGGLPVQGAIKQLKRHEIAQFFNELSRNEEVK